MQRLGRHLEVRVNIVNEVAVALGAATADDIMWQRIAHVYVLQVVVVPGKVRLHACHLRARQHRPDAGTRCLARLLLASQKALHIPQSWAQ